MTESGDTTGRGWTQGGRPLVHPGAGRRKPPAVNKGRPRGPADAARCAAILAARFGEGAPRRDELIEALHAIQDAEGCLPEGLLHALAEAMRLSMAEVYEGATF
jgi:hypothetical protein